jgi:hypothetical protein
LERGITGVAIRAESSQRNGGLAFLEYEILLTCPLKVDPQMPMVAGRIQWTSVGGTLVPESITITRED